MEKSLVSLLRDWFAHPVIEIHVCDAVEMKVLKSENEALKSDLKRTEAAYSRECQQSMRYLDELRKHDISI